MMHISTHTHIHTLLEFNWCSTLICSFYPYLVPLLLFFIKWSFPLLASSNESVMPPRTHLSKHVGRMAQLYTHTHLQSATISLSQLELFVIPLPSIPRSCVWLHLIMAAMSLCLTASHSLVRSHLTADFIRAHLVALRMSSAVSVVSSA